MLDVEHYVNVGPDQRLKIYIQEMSVDHGNNSSDVRVRGDLYNDGNYRVWNTYGTTSRSISGSGSYSPGPFGFDLGPNSNWTFIDHTFVIKHTSNGTKTVSFTVHYGVTDVNFGNNKSCSASLTLTRIGSVPDAPGQPQFSNVTPTSLTVSWAKSPDDGGSSIQTYELRRWKGSSQSGSFVDSKANNLTRNITGLVAGQTYTFAVHAENGIGWSDWSNDNHVTLAAGVRIRVGGEWKMAVPYVRANGVWKQAVPYVRSGGTWHPAN